MAGVGGDGSGPLGERVAHQCDAVDLADSLHERVDRGPVLLDGGVGGGEENALGDASGLGDAFGEDGEPPHGFHVVDGEARREVDAQRADAGPEDH